MHKIIYCDKIPEYYKRECLIQLMINNPQLSFNKDDFNIAPLEMYYSRRIH